MVDSYEFDPSTGAGMVRLLVNDVSDPFVFTDAEIAGFLALESGNVKRAAAQAIDTNADNEVLASKVLRSQDVQTDGAKAADSLRKRAAALREQADVDAELNDSFFDTIDLDPPLYPNDFLNWPNL